MLKISKSGRWIYTSTSSVQELLTELTNYFIVIACLDIFAVSHNNAVNSHKNKVTGVASRVVRAIDTTPRLLVYLASGTPVLLLYHTGSLKVHNMSLTIISKSKKSQQKEWSPFCLSINCTLCFVFLYFVSLKFLYTYNTFVLCY